MICNKKHEEKGCISVSVPRLSNIYELQENLSGTKIHATALIYFQCYTV